MDAFTRGHLRAWAEGYFLEDQEVELAVLDISTFIAEHPDILEPPRMASWPEVWQLVERQDSSGVAQQHSSAKVHPPSADSKPLALESGEVK